MPGGGGLIPGGGIPIGAPRPGGIPIGGPIGGRMPGGGPIIPAEHKFCLFFPPNLYTYDYFLRKGAKSI